MIFTQDSTQHYSESIEPFRIVFLSCAFLSIDKSLVSGSLHSNILVCVTDGNAVIEIASSKYKVARENCIYIPKNRSYSISPEGICSLITVEFDYDYPLPLFSKRQGCLFENIPDIKHSFNRIYETSLFRKPLPGYLEACLILLLDQLSRYTASDKSSILFARFCELIEKNSHKSISAKEIASELGCTYEHLCRVVKKRSDKSVNNLIGECRVKRIMSLCGDATLSVDDIASRLDFGSAELLRKYFKYHSGEALSDYRSRIKSVLP